MGCYCEQGSCGQSKRVFLTHEEKVNILHDYQNDLQQEMKAVSERIADLKKA